MKGRPSPNRGKKFPPETLTEDEVRALLGACSPTSSTGIRNRAVIIVLYRTGLRANEALTLFPKDVDQRAGTITVLHGKNDKRRVVGVDPGAMGILARWIDRRERMGFTGRQPLFCTISGATRGKRLYTSYLRNLLPRLATKAGVEKRVHAHGLRHTHAYELLTESKDVGVIRAQLGHAHLATTWRYLDHLAPARAIAEVQARDFAVD